MDPLRSRMSTKFSGVSLVVSPLLFVSMSKRAFFVSKTPEIACGLSGIHRISISANSALVVILIRYTTWNSSKQTAFIKKNALAFYTKAYEIDKKIIPIDKYAFYNSFNQIASINIASIYKLTDLADRAWENFKDILTYETGTSNYFHSAIYLAIAEAGLSDIINLKNFHERKKWSDGWQRFFELSFHELSGSYRQCIVSGALSMGFKFSTDPQTYDNAIICFEKVIQISKKFFKISRDYYNNIIQCYQQLARMYRLKHKYTLAIKYASEILNICRIDDLQAVNDCYTNLVK
ncbi:unnamed protein product, partial [Rotaria sp. Silwood2]